MDRRPVAYAIASIVLGFGAQRVACAGERALSALDGSSPAESALAASVAGRRAVDAPWADGAPPEATVQDAAEACGVLAIPRSPAEILVALDGGVADVAIESDLFGGPDAESCIASRLRAHGRAADPRARTVRYALDTFFPER